MHTPLFVQLGLQIGWHRADLSKPELILHSPELHLYFTEPMGLFQEYPALHLTVAVIPL